MFCKKCGKEIQDDAQFCPVCGENQGNMGKMEEEETEGKGNILGSVAVRALETAGTVAVTVIGTILKEPIKKVTKDITDAGSKKVIEVLKDKGLVKKNPMDKAKDLAKKGAKIFKKQKERR